jgi:hypothetical protein
MNIKNVKKQQDARYRSVLKDYEDIMYLQHPDRGMTQKTDCLRRKTIAKRKKILARKMSSLTPDQRKMLDDEDIEDIS